ncbi:glucose-6-phosphate isomerase [Pseudofulvibacter geojedonensis]|uniref:Glucose-6-phosphate isomerase n=1 Tax=Pseudofulvibacter geojedonensis TaxID=1123758 RepID=A0ABW3I2G0_9FLAO
MSFSKINPKKTKSWLKLKEHYKQVSTIHLSEMFAADKNRSSNFSVGFDDFFVDFSKQRWTRETQQLFISLANELDLKNSIRNYFRENEFNFTEKRAVLHTALRSKEESVLLNGKNIIREVRDVKAKIKCFTNSVISGEYKGANGKKITDIVNIGIGGSDLGPKLVCNALKHYQNHLNIHFVSNIDGDHLYEVLSVLPPETTLFIIVSKSFTTAETIKNATSIKKWFVKNLEGEAFQRHFVAVTTNIEQAEEFGIERDNIFPMWDWVGGRFSLWSAVGLSIALSIGFNQYEELLSGAQIADKHFKEASLEENLPVLMAFLTIWHVNFFKADQEAVIPYSQYLEDLVPYLQQSFMESNGKNVDRNGEKINYHTCPTIFGGVGCNAQHAFMQLFHQGKHLIPTDFIGFCNPLKANKEHHNVLMANLFAQTEALAFGTYGKNIDNSFKIFNGNQPSTTILIKKLTPSSLGKLLAIYEHKIFVEGILWNINSYDQFGVELGKELSRGIIEKINENNEKQRESLLLNFYKN